MGRDRNYLEPAESQNPESPPWWLKNGDWLLLSTLDGVELVGQHRGGVFPEDVVGVFWLQRDGWCCC